MEVVKFDIQYDIVFRNNIYMTLKEKEDLLAQKENRAIKLIRYYNKGFNKSDFDTLLNKPSLNLFYSCVGKMPENYIEEVDAQTFEKLFYEVLELKK